MAGEILPPINFDRECRYSNIPLFSCICNLGPPHEVVRPTTEMNLTKI